MSFYLIKKNICFILFVPIITLSQNYNLGLFGGVNFSEIKGFESEDDFSSELAFKIGFQFEYNLSKTVSVLTSPNYERKSVGTTSSVFNPSYGSFVDYSTKINHNYLTFPLVLRYKIQKNDFSFFINSGPYISLLQSVTKNNVNIGLETNGYKDVQYGVVVGIGMLYRINDDYNLSIEVRDNLGLTNIRTVPVDFNNGEVRTNSISLLLGFNFIL